MITAEEIINSYKVSSIKPINGLYVEIDSRGKFCGCALTSLYVVYHGILPDDDDDVYNWAVDYYGLDTVSSVMCGFDTPNRVVVTMNITDRIRQINQASQAAQMLGLS